jgi:quercetin dioxygenase-like cupin family protein
MQQRGISKILATLPFVARHEGSSTDVATARHGVSEYGTRPPRPAKRAVPALAVALVLVTGTVVLAGLNATSPSLAVAQQGDTPPVGPVGFTSNTLLQTSTTVKGQPIRFPLGDSQFTAVLGEIAPGGQAGRHMHPVPLVVYMLEGALSIEMEGYGTYEVNAGESFTEVVHTWHNGRNLGSTPAKFLIVFAGQDGTPITVRP